MMATLKMHFFHDNCVTGFCSCKIGIPYFLCISPISIYQYFVVVSTSLRLLLLLPWMASMLVLQEQKPVAEKLQFLELPSEEAHYGYS
jgi:hypothetical protein